MVVVSIERACNILSKIVKNITWLPNTSSYILVWMIMFFKIIITPILMLQCF